MSDLSTQATYILQHCFVGECKKFASRALEHQLLDTKAKHDLTYIEKLQEYGAAWKITSEIYDQAFDRLFIYENRDNPIIATYLYDQFPDEKYTKYRDYEHSFLVSGRMVYLLGGDPLPDMYSFNYLPGILSKVLGYHYGYEESKQQMKEHGLSAVGGGSQADYQRNILFMIAESFPEIKHYLQQWRENK